MRTVAIQPTFEAPTEFDEMVMAACQTRRLPCVITLGGGYAREVADTVDAHCNTLRAARAVFGN